MLQWHPRHPRSTEEAGVAPVRLGPRNMFERENERCCQAEPTGVRVFLKVRHWEICMTILHQTLANLLSWPTHVDGGIFVVQLHEYFDQLDCE